MRWDGSEVPWALMRMSKDEKMFRIGILQLRHTQAFSAGVSGLAHHSGVPSTGSWHVLSLSGQCLSLSFPSFMRVMGDTSAEKYQV